LLKKIISDNIKQELAHPSLLAIVRDERMHRTCRLVFLAEEFEISGFRIFIHEYLLKNYTFFGK
jgi:hypothetical protein